LHWRRRDEEYPMKRIALTTFALTALIASNASANYQSAHLRAGLGPVPNAVSEHLTDNGGPMINNVKIFLIFYSPGYQYKDQLVKFYTAITQSAYVDMLQEYDNKSGYKVRRGSYLGVFEDMNKNPSSITTVHPQTYLSGLITAKKVPAPDDNTLYMMYFPSNIDPDMPGQGGGSSCVKGGGFCAYHSSYASGSQNVYFGVMPDTPDDCTPGCGPSGFTGLTDVSSHEMIEAMTDPDVGQNDVAWYDDNNGEIGDICATGSDETAVVDTWTVQKEWSNQLNSCVATNPKYSVNDFSLTADASVMVPQGGMATAMVSLTKVAGMAENVALTATAPTGVTASFSPTSASSDAGKSTLTISASATAMLGMSKVTVKAAGSSVTKTQDIMVNVVAPPDMAMASGGGTGGTGGGGSGGNGGGGSGGNGTGGNGTGGNGNNGGGGSDSGCSMGGGGIAGSWAFAGLVLLALAFRRRRAK
jgi:MYXO-CTERM domain-containing protein